MVVKKKKPQAIDWSRVRQRPEDPDAGKLILRKSKPLTAEQQRKKKADQKTADANRARAGQGLPPVTTAGLSDIERGIPPWVQEKGHGQVTDAQIAQWQRTYEQLHPGKRYASQKAFLADPDVLNGSSTAQFSLSTVTGHEVADTGETFTTTSSNRGRGPDNHLAEPSPLSITVHPSNTLAASHLAPGSTQYLSEVMRHAVTYGVPWQLVWAVINQESSWDVNTAPGDGGQSHGIGQIYRPAHPEVSDEQANDPHFSIQFVAKRLAKGFAETGDWGLAALYYNNESEALSFRSTGKGSPRLARHDADYVSGVFSALEPSKNGDDVGFYNEPQVKAHPPVLDPVTKGSGSGSGANDYSVPDPVGLHDNAVKLLTSWNMDASPSQLAGLADQITGLYRSQVTNGAAGNPYADNANYAAGRQSGTANGSTGELVIPVPGAKFTDDWGNPRSGGRHHGGTDLFAPRGTPIVAAVGGTVINEGDDGGKGGLRVWVKGDDGRFYYYAHMDSASTYAGAVVQAGAQIGTVGDSGDAKGGATHLHFGINTEGTRNTGVNPAEQGWINPFPILQGGADAGPAIGQGRQGNEKIEFDPSARIAAGARALPQYQQLFGAKPAGQSEEDYTATFNRGVGTLLGAGVQVGPQAARIGMQAGDTAAALGAAAGTNEALSTASSFRSRLFDVGQLLNGLV